jgi:hypothetical protein
MINFEWELRVESLRLRVLEAQIALELKLADVREVRADVCRAHIQIVSKTLEPMQAQYKVVSEDQERALAQAKADEDQKAVSAHDPLEQFRARRTAELLALEALVVRSEQTLVVTPTWTSPTSRNCSTMARSAGSTRFA